MLTHFAQIRGVAAATTALLLSTCAAWGCGREATPDDEADMAPIVVRPPGTTPRRWVLTEVARDAGRNPRIAANASGDVGVAFFSEGPELDGPCDELGIDSPPTRQRWTLSYAPRTGDAWPVEEVGRYIHVGTPAGLGLALDASGVAHIATMTGEPVELLRYCGVNNVTLLSREGAGTWREDVAVRTSGEAPSDEPGSNFGEVVGLWPALALDSSGAPAIAYQDVHGGGLQSDDRRRADLELAWRRGGWEALAVDMGRGAGDRNALVFDGQERLVVAYHIPTVAQNMAQQGLWVRRSVDGVVWEEVQLYSVATGTGHGLLWHPEEEALYVLYRDTSRGFPVLVKQQDDAQFESLSRGWASEELGDSRYDEGYGAQLAVSPQGRLLAAYYRCGEATSGLGNCLPGDDALVFSWRDGEEWVTEVVDEGSDDGLCGMEPSLTVGSDGAIYIAYRCEVVEGGELAVTVKVARRERLP